MIIGVVLTSFLILRERKPPASEAEPGDISDWKDYVNKNWKYKLKYPSDWYINEGQDGIAVDILSYDVETKPYIKDPSKRIGITVFPNRQTMPPPNYPPGVIVQTKYINAGGIEAQEDILNDESKNRQIKWIWIEKNGILYWLVVSLENPQTVKIFNQILGTFDFLE